MAQWVKIPGQGWVNIDAIFRKSGGSWNTITFSQFQNYIAGAVLKYGYHSQALPVHTLVISGPSSPLGTTAAYVAVYDGNPVSNNVVWSVASGSSYATISQTGELTILSGAEENQAIISATYAGITSNKELSVTYEAGTTSETETETSTETNDSGQTITTTTTTTVITDASRNRRSLMTQKMP